MIEVNTLVVRSIPLDLVDDPLDRGWSRYCCFVLSAIADIISYWPYELYFPWGERGSSSVPKSFGVFDLDVWVFEALWKLLLVAFFFRRSLLISFLRALLSYSSCLYNYRWIISCCCSCHSLFLSILSVVYLLRIASSFWNGLKSSISIPSFTIIPFKCSFVIVFSGWKESLLPNKTSLFLLFLSKS